MKLIELEPRWIHENLFIFRCPHCQDIWLTCKTAAMTRRETWEILENGLGDNWNQIVVPPNPEAIWRVSGIFPDSVTVHPSIDASASGHWHGFITNGELN